MAARVGRDRSRRSSLRTRAPTPFQIDCSRQTTMILLSSSFLRDCESYYSVFMSAIRARRFIRLRRRRKVPVRRPSRGGGQTLTWRFTAPFVVMTRTRRVWYYVLFIRRSKLWPRGSGETHETLSSPSARRGSRSRAEQDARCEIGKSRTVKCHVCRMICCFFFCFTVVRIERPFVSNVLSVVKTKLGPHV